MSVAVICPIGTLAENGYQHVAEPCIKSQAEFADAVYLVQSHPDVRNLGWTPENVTLVSNPYTWFTNGYDGDQMNRNLDTGFKLAKDAGHSVGVAIPSNSYIPKHHMVKLRHMLDVFIEEGADWDYYFRGNLIGGRLYRPSKRLPYIVNLRNYPEVRVSFAPDGLYMQGMLMPTVYGDYSIYEALSIVDVPLEMTLDEFAAKMNWFRCYSDLMPKRKPVMDWEYWRRYYEDKTSRMILSDDCLDDYGREITSRIKPEFISHQIMEAYDLRR